MSREHKADRFLGAVLESNRQARAVEERWAPHRERVTELIAAHGGPGASLCLLGPGNLLDVRLDALAAAFAAIDLVDLDEASVRAALERRRPAGPAAWRVHPPTDLTGILGHLPCGRHADPPAAARALVDRLGRHRCAMAGRTFGVTASTGVLTQMLQSVVDSALLPAGVVRVCVALRDKHLRDLVELTRPGGTVVLVSDVVASTTAPQLAGADPGALEPLMARLVAAGNFFTGTNPYRIVALLEEDERFRADVHDVRLADPWLWAVTADRVHLTYAIVARRGGDDR